MAQIVSHDISVSLLKANDAVAEELKKHFQPKNTLVINLLSSPGSGKTTLLEKLSDHFDKEKTCVLVGDLETERDAERIRKQGVTSFQIVTGGTCHLEAVMVKQALEVLPENLDYLFIENVGNLVCPTSYNLGEDLRIVMLSVPEGDDKVFKYPKAFLTSSVLVISKSDLLPYVPFEKEKVVAEAKEVNPNIKVFFISALKGEGIKELADYIHSYRKEMFEKG
ncbi:MAG: hydrogenase nickel incorporation protein HypB [Bacteroidetes bacterium]|nr:hydrogenase nickel incorporation protein HypB [Bacteroidota bacterium]